MIGPMFRRERPQKGRYRQFFQIDAEVIGPPSSGSELPMRDAELIDMLTAILDAVGLRGWSLQLNSVGCPKCRPLYNQALREALAGVKDKMCVDCQRRAETNPLRVLDCKVPADQPIIETLPKISQYLDEECRENFAEVRAILDSLAIPYTINERMVRGLDYYTRTTFEFTHGELGAQSAVLGGGRYDGLSELLGGPRAPATGFAIGEDRLVLALQSQAASVIQTPAAYIIPLGAGMNRHALKLARELRRAGLIVDVGDESFRLKKGFEAAGKLGAKYAILVGENEVSGDTFAVKNLATGEQVAVARADLAARLQATFMSDHRYNSAGTGADPESSDRWRDELFVFSTTFVKMLGTFTFLAKDRRKFAGTGHSGPLSSITVSYLSVCQFLEVSILKA